MKYILLVLFLFFLGCQSTSNEYFIGDVVQYKVDPRLRAICPDLGKIISRTSKNKYRIEIIHENTRCPMYYWTIKSDDITGLVTRSNIVRK